MKSGALPKFNDAVFSESNIEYGRRERELLRELFVWAGSTEPGLFWEFFEICGHSRWDSLAPLIVDIGTCDTCHADTRTAVVACGWLSSIAAALRLLYFA